VLTEEKALKAVVQRVVSAQVTVDGSAVGTIGPGFVVLLGIGHGDGEPEAQWMADKISHLRIFEDDNGKFNRSLLDVGGAVLLISQFTLYGDAQKGRRPSFSDAAPPNLAEPTITRVAQLLEGQGVRVQSGRFQTHMLVEIHNDGPVTIVLEREAVV
jgi:D-aminoacyl-tRNA deacylase